MTENGIELPAYLSVSLLEKTADTFEAGTFSKWADSPKASNYLVTLTGDGEYRLKDILSATQLLQNSSFAVVLGSRTQSRRQFLKSLRSAYGEGTFLYWLSWLGSFVITAFFGARFGVVFSDPLTGFRMYRRDRLSPDLMNALRNKTYFNSVALTKYLLKAHVEIAEIPVTYKTFSGFTRPGWRFLRGLKSLMSLFG